MCFADRCDHAIFLFLRAKILPIHFLYDELLQDVNNDVIPSQLKDLFIPTAKIYMDQWVNGAISQQGLDFQDFIEKNNVVI